MKLTNYVKGKDVWQKSIEYLDKIFNDKKKVEGNKVTYNNANIQIELVMHKKTIVWLTVKTKYNSGFIECYKPNLSNSVNINNVMVVRYNQVIPNFTFLEFILNINNVNSILNQQTYGFFEPDSN